MHGNLTAILSFGAIAFGTLAYIVASVRGFRRMTSAQIDAFVTVIHLVSLGGSMI